jgi:sugar porter (SP) family MFS transporter
MIAAAIAAIGQIIQSSSFGLGQLIVGRIVSGMGNGGVNAVVPVWQSECTAPASRGKNVVIVGIFISSGIAAAGWVNVGFSSIKSCEIAWRFPLALPLIFAFMIIAFTLLFPESPRWLISKGQLAEAHAAMWKLSKDVTIDDEVISLEINNISSLHQQGSQRERGFLDLFQPSSQRLFYRLCLAISINFCAQMTGANVISYYGSTIFKESLGLSEKKAALLNAGVLTWKIVAATSAYFSVDRFGRKPLFITACLGMGLSMAALSGSVWAIEYRNSFGASVAATFFLFAFMAFFPLGFIGANFLYSAEIAPQDLRLHLAAIGTATHWLFNFVIVEITPIAFVTIRWKYYIVYAVIGVSVAALVYLLFPETNGRSLEEMDEMFSEPEHWWQVPVYAQVLKTHRPDISPAKSSVKHVEKI